MPNDDLKACGFGCRPEPPVIGDEERQHIRQRQSAREMYGVEGSEFGRVNQSGSFNDLAAERDEV